jgi:endonuclease/exonuclease/phosphatase family metal-dependent hydrolase
MHMRASALVVVTLSLAALAGCADPSGMMMEPQTYAASCDGNAALDRPLKIANYNIKSGLWSTLDEVAAVVEDLDADVIALEEVDNGLPRSGGVDQSAALAEKIGAQRIFAGAWEKDGGAYGIALLSKMPLLQSERFELPEANGFEPRVGIDASLCAGDRELRIVASHADFLPWSAKAHAEALGERIADDDDVVLAGDFNIPPEHESIVGIVAKGFKDVIGEFTDEPTFADSRIDYVMTDRAVSEAHVVDSDASDHKPVFTLMPFDG